MGTILERWLHWMVVAGLGTWGLSAVPERPSAAPASAPSAAALHHRLQEKPS